MKLRKALRTKTLPQYMESEDVMARFLAAAHGEHTTEIRRTEYRKGERTIRASELQLDAMDDFITRGTALKDEFYGDLKDVVGAAKADTFCSILGGARYDGSSRRNGQEVLPLRTSVEGYLRNTHGTTVTEEPSSALLTPTEVGQLLELTWRLLDTCVEDWIEKHGRDYASSHVFFRRGLVLPNSSGMHICIAKSRSSVPTHCP